MEHFDWTQSTKDLKKRIKFLQSRLRSESGKDARETEYEIELIRVELNGREAL